MGKARRKATPAQPSKPVSPLESMTRFQLRELHDSDLSDRAGRGDRLAAEVLEARTKAAAVIRDTLARVYARGDKATFSQWGCVPCLTETGNIGVLDICDGTAWDTTVPCPPEAEDLGLSGAAIAGANNPAAGASVYEVDGPVEKLETVDRRGPTKSMLVTLEPRPGLQGFTPAPKMPPGWRQIELPTWRGHEGTSPYRPTPKECYTPDKWVRPRQVAFGLMTCYGKPGKPRRTLDDTAAWHVDRWPVGLPDWVTPGFEQVDPRWWPLSPEQETEVIRLADEWLAGVCKRLAAHLPNAADVVAALDAGDDVYRLANRYPDQAERYDYRVPEEVFNHGVQYSRAEAAREAAGKAAEEFGVRRAYRCRERPDAVIGLRLIDYFHGILTRTLYRRLEPVAEALRWMLSVPGPNSSNLGPHRPHFEAALKAAALEAARVLCDGLEQESRKLVEEDMVAVLYANGPVYFTT